MKIGPTMNIGPTICVHHRQELSAETNYCRWVTGGCGVEEAGNEISREFTVDLLHGGYLSLHGRLKKNGFEKESN